MLGMEHSWNFLSLFAYIKDDDLFQVYFKKGYKALIMFEDRCKETLDDEKGLAVRVTFYANMIEYAYNDKVIQIKDKCLVIYLYCLMGAFPLPGRTWMQIVLNTVVRTNPSNLEVACKGKLARCQKGESRLRRFLTPPYLLAHHLHWNKKPLCAHLYRKEYLKKRQSQDFFPLYNECSPDSLYSYFFPLHGEHSGKEPVGLLGHLLCIEALVNREIQWFEVLYDVYYCKIEEYYIFIFRDSTGSVPGSGYGIFLDKYLQEYMIPCLLWEGHCDIINCPHKLFDFELDWNKKFFRHCVKEVFLNRNKKIHGKVLRLSDLCQSPLIVYLFLERCYAIEDLKIRQEDFVHAFTENKYPEYGEYMRSFVAVLEQAFKPVYRYQATVGGTLHTKCFKLNKSMLARVVKNAFCLPASFLLAILRQNEYFVENTWEEIGGINLCSSD